MIPKEVPTKGALKKDKSHKVLGPSSKYHCFCWEGGCLLGLGMGRVMFCFVDIKHRGFHALSPVLLREWKPSQFRGAAELHLVNGSNAM